VKQVSRFEIFRRHSDGQIEWVERRLSLDDAKDRAKHLATPAPGDYFILDAENARIVPGDGDRPIGANSEGDSAGTAPNGARGNSKNGKKNYAPPVARKVRIPE
jgi:hypothetical protein